MPKISQVISPRDVAFLHSISHGRFSDVDLTLGDPFGPNARVRSGPGCYDCQCYSPHAHAEESHFIRVATSVPGTIYINQDAWEPGTAAWLSLIRHEQVHQEQFSQYPNFAELYNAYEERRLAKGMPPYTNPLEHPAYVAEAEAYKKAIAMGYPPGKRIPLLLSPY